MPVPKHLRHLVELLQVVNRREARTHAQAPIHRLPQRRTIFFKAVHEKGQS